MTDAVQINVFDPARLVRMASASCLGILFTVAALGSAPSVAAAEHEVVFENLEHDFPQRIIYRRQGDLMVARIEGDGPGETKARQWEWHLVD